jgi:hypothetical protein
MGKENIADNLTLRAQLVNGAPEIGGVPEDDGRNGEIEPHSAVTDLSHVDLSHLHPSHEPGAHLSHPDRRRGRHRKRLDDQRGLKLGSLNSDAKGLWDEVFNSGVGWTSACRTRHLRLSRRTRGS